MEDKIVKGIPQRSLRPFSAPSEVKGFLYDTSKANVEAPRP
jgi:hypothetical protein